jgi:predicted dinucleotide-binding enzyme
VSKKIGILGSGAVAQVLAAGFLKYGYQVTVGTRDNEKLKVWLSKNTNAVVGSFDDAAKFGSTIVLAVKGTVAEGLVKELAPHLAGKTIIDTTNPIADAPPVNGVLRYFTAMNESLMERLQNAAPAANFVKAFNSVSNTIMVNPNMASGKPTMFIAGNSDAARRQVGDILDQFGWETGDMGMAEAARAIEPLCMLWCIPAMTGRSKNHAFKLLKN